VNLADYTTVHLGGPARRFVRAGTEEDLIEAVRAADSGGEPLLVLGGGSNLVVADQGFDGTVVQVATAGVRQGPEPGLVTVAAGEDWDAVVAGTVAAGLAGLECLSGIPGQAGATPIRHDHRRTDLRPGDRGNRHFSERPVRIRLPNQRVQTR